MRIISRSLLVFYSRTTGTVIPIMLFLLLITDPLNNPYSFTDGRHRYRSDRSLRLSVSRRDGDGRAGRVVGRARRRRGRRRRARQQSLQVSTVSREHALMRHKLMLAFVTNPHHCVGWRERVLQTWIAGAGSTGAEPRSV